MYIIEKVSAWTNRSIKNMIVLLVEKCTDFKPVGYLCHLFVSLYYMETRTDDPTGLFQGISRQQEEKEVYIHF